MPSLNVLSVTYGTKDNPGGAIFEIASLKRKTYLHKQYVTECIETMRRIVFFLMHLSTYLFDDHSYWKRWTEIVIH